MGAERPLISQLPLTACWCMLQVFGDNFVHGGRPGTGPKYVDPQELLSSPTVDPYVPYYDR